MPRRLGQHFMHDQDALGRIVQALGIRPGDVFVEIGPGRGALTEHLIAALDRPLRAIEIDRSLCDGLAERWGSEALHLECADALEYPWADSGLDPAGTRIVGNLPYNISTALMTRLFEFNPADMHVVVQREVANRLSAVAGTRSYGRLTLAVQIYGSAESLFEIPPGSFSPPPKVHSALVQLVRRPEPLLLPDAAMLEKLLRRTFSRRRKMLRSSLGESDLIRSAGIDPEARPEQLSLFDFIRLSRAFSERR
ncbi:MAG: ribosomal RNA small subunit methyltransferase A [Gammaproteobacteria bacterium AqS3]|nr:ribosomal RNA small subunit methyltransferase A [Gammaproteobacteria bacterium AqS3]